jgi:hypothetical protein
MVIHRLLRALVSLAAAQVIVAALFLGSVAAGRAAALPAPVCSALRASDNGGSSAPLSRDLACLVSGCCCAAPGFTPPVTAKLPPRAISFIIWQNAAEEQFAPAISRSHEARAPPAQLI